MKQMCSTEEMSKALKVLLDRIKKHSLDKEKMEKSHTCNNCKYCHGVEGYDQQWGMTYCVHSWCDKDKNLMDSWKDGNITTSHYLVPCDFFEHGEGQYDKYKGGI